MGEKYGRMKEEIILLANTFARFLLKHPELDYKTVSNKADEYFKKHQISSQNDDSFLKGVSVVSGFSVQDCKIFSILDYLVHFYYNHSKHYTMHHVVHQVKQLSAAA